MAEIRNILASMSSPPRLTCLARTALILVLASSPVVAQDSHHWTEQFGNRSHLLSGAVVADPADLSSIFYNPGGLALTDSSELLLAGFGVEFSGLTLRDALAPGVGLEATSVQAVPSLIAGAVPIGGERDRVAYSILTRHQSRFRMYANAFSSGNGGEPAQPQLLDKSQELNAAISEYWIGGTWARELRPGLGVGVSTFLAGRFRRFSSAGLVQTIDADGLAAVVTQSYRYNYGHWRVLWKLGVNARAAGWMIGAVVTTRGLALGGTADLAANTTLVDQAPPVGGLPSTFVATTAQSELTVDYRSPLSVSFGVSRRVGATTLHVTGEWFEGVDLYDVVKAQPFRAQTADVLIDVAVRERLQAVFNVAVAAEHVFSDSLRAYAGFHTDFSGAVHDVASNASFTTWDFYHLSGGATASFLGEDFTLGADLSLGSDTVTADPQDPFFPVGLPDETDVSASRLTIIFGFNFSL